MHFIYVIYDRYILSTIQKYIHKFYIKLATIHRQQNSPITVRIQNRHSNRAGHAFLHHKPDHYSLFKQHESLGFPFSSLGPDWNCKLVAFATSRFDRRIGRFTYEIRSLLCFIIILFFLLNPCWKYFFLSSK